MSWTIGHLLELTSRNAVALEEGTAEDNQSTFDQIERTVLAACEEIGISWGEFYVRERYLLEVRPGSAYDMQLERLATIYKNRFGAAAGRLSHAIAA